MAATHATYAEKAGNNDATAEQVRGGKPVFVKHRDIPSDSEFFTEHMYKALAHTIPSAEITGIQKIRGLWRLYIGTQKTRIELITLGLKVRNVCVAVYDTNPFHIHGEDAVRVRVKDVPLSASDTVITDELESRKFKVIGKIIYERLRVDGKLTDCLTGDRLVYIEKPTHSLPRNITFGLFRGRVFHPGQMPTEPSAVTCSRCLIAGHHRSQCTKDVICKQCNMSGHIARDCKGDFPPLSSTSDAPTGPALPHGKPASTRTRSTERTFRDQDQLIDTPPPLSNVTPAGRRSRANITQQAPTMRERPGPSDVRIHNVAHTPSQESDQLIDTPSHTPHTHQASKPQATGGKSQAKITQFVVNTGGSAQDEYTSNSQDDYSTADSDNSEYDDTTLQQSELSAESPELIKTHLEKEAEKKATKRKQKSHKRLSKKK